MRSEPSEVMIEVERRLQAEGHEIPAAILERYRKAPSEAIDRIVQLMLGVVTRRIGSQSKASRHRNSILGSSVCCLKRRTIVALIVVVTFRS